ncbi:MAG TPA: hypothetical protein VJ476_13245 [Rhizomicrobium sp.]|nr:hypothetical protein [Rhizomicrobium sp.]
MREPNASNTAQQKSDSVKPAPVKLDPLANCTVPEEDGAVHGGEETKPGQMQGDEDISPNAPQGEIEEKIKQRTVRPPD